MTPKHEQVEAVIAEQAAEWLVAHDDGALGANESAALAAWLKGSPVHVEKFLGVAAVARELRAAATDPEYSVDACVALARTDNAEAVVPLRRRVRPLSAIPPRQQWMVAVAASAVLAAVGLVTFSRPDLWPFAQRTVVDEAVAEHFETRHGEQLEQRLADGSVLHLDTESAATVRYSKAERLVTLHSGRAEFDVTHEGNRPFRVRAGSAEVTDLGTRFDVRLDQGATVVTVVEGRVAVKPADSGAKERSRSIGLSANQRIRVSEAEWPATPVTVDAERATAWLHQQIAFDNESLERVAAEYSRYTSKQIEIASPALRNLRISGVFATDDPEAFIAFLRSLKGVRVEVTETRIRVSGG